MGKIVKPRSGRHGGVALLMDTHVWLWYLDGATHELPETITALLRSANRSHDLLVSDIAVWEIATKVAKGKLRLAVDVALWVRRAERAPGIAFLPIDREVLLLSTTLPGVLHGDPADRILIASALLHACTLVTADRAIIEYAGREKATALTVMDART